MCARSAVRILRNGGLVCTMHGRGSFVADPLPVQLVADGARLNDSDRAPRRSAAEETGVDSGFRHWERPEVAGRGEGGAGD